MKEDQFRAHYKKAVDQMKPNNEMKQGLIDKMEQRQPAKRSRKPMYIAASIVLAAGIGLAAPSVMQQLNGPASPAQTAQVTPGADPVVIPKTEFGNSNPGVSASMMALVVYQNNVYLQAATQIDSETATALLGDKLGTTTGGIHELSGQEEYIELASNIGEADIYSVKGYDSGFRIMSYTEIDGQVFAQLFERTTGITVSSGADLIGKLNLEGNIASAQWQSFDSWNNGLQQYAPLAEGEALDRFTSALLTARPLAAEPLIEQGLYDGEDRKFIYLTLEDNTTVELTLFGEGLVRYGNAQVFFEVEDGAFQALWDAMTP